MTARRHSPEWLIKNADPEIAFERACASALTRLLAENAELQQQLEAIGAGGVGPLMPTAAPQPPAAEQEPLFWYRPRGDGYYEGPIHNAAIELVRKLSGGWVPLHPHQQSQATDTNDQALQAIERLNAELGRVSEQRDGLLEALKHIATMTNWINAQITKAQGAAA